MGGVTPSAARRLARFVLGLRLEDIPSPVVTKATHLVLDTLGCALAATRYDFGGAALGTAERLGGPHESTLVGSKVRVAAANAVLANATLAHGLDFDDTREDAIVHTGSVAITTGLAVGEALGASGPATLAAMVGGVEVMCRVGLAVPGKFHARHYHPTALVGTFGAAAVAGKLHGSTEDQLVHAFGVCGSQAGGIIEYLADGTWTKRLHPGWAAHAGVVATLLARSGEPLGAKRPPPTGYAAKFSLPYLLAVILVRGRAGLAEFEDEAVRDPEVLGVASRVGYELDPTIDYPRQFVGHVAIQLRDGRRLEERQDHPRGGAELPMTREELEAKFRGNAGLVVSGEQASRVIRSVSALGTAASLDGLVEALTP